MKKSILVVLAMVFSFVCAGLVMAAVENGKLVVKAGDEIYVCNCGEKCPCETMGKKAGKCSCGKEMTKVSVTKVEEDKATFMLDGKERAMKTTGKFACACGAKCDCDFISQKAGKCSCGKEMKEVK
jgi:hypothetical protein